MKPTEQKDTNSIRIFAWNVNGIRAVLRSGELKNFIEKTRPQILCLNETKIDDETLKKDGIMQEIEKLGFSVKNQHWNCSQTKKGYSGTAIFIDTSIENQFIKVSMNLPTLDEREGRVVTA